MYFGSAVSLCVRQSEVTNQGYAVIEQKFGRVQLYILAAAAENYLINYQLRIQYVLTTKLPPGCQPVLNCAEASLKIDWLENTIFLAISVLDLPHYHASAHGGETLASWQFAGLQSGCYRIATSCMAGGFCTFRVILAVTARGINQSIWCPLFPCIFRGFQSENIDFM